MGRTFGVVPEDIREIVLYGKFDVFPIRVHVMWELVRERTKRRTGIWICQKEFRFDQQLQVIQSRIYRCAYAVPLDQIPDLFVSISGILETLSNEEAESVSKKTEGVRLNYAKLLTHGWFPEHVVTVDSLEPP